ncbi:MAG: ROK family protein [Clostridia bacterium]|nr:ROK family protein [Clostridia bacterium]
MGKLLVLDVGGTFIKYGTADEKGCLLRDSVRQIPAHAQDDAGAFFEALQTILREQGTDADSACVSIAGPFDFDKGISLMKHKFASLYGLSLRAPFEKRGVPVSFLHDSTAFMLGEYMDGTLQGASNACCVMLGTGLGFAWMKDGRVCVDEKQAPALPLWNMPYRDGIAEDYVSARAIQRYFGGSLTVREIAGLARSGDERAVRAFRMAGEELSNIVSQIISHLGCEKFALGGQISKSADLLQLRLPIPWAVTSHPEDAALFGACRYAALGRNRCVRAAPLSCCSLKAKR